MVGRLCKEHSLWSVGAPFNTKNGFMKTRTNKGTNIDKVKWRRPTRQVQADGQKYDNYKIMLGSDSTY